MSRALPQADGHNGVEECPDCMTKHAADEACDLKCPACEVPLEPLGRRFALRCPGCGFARESSE